MKEDNNLNDLYGERFIFGVFCGIEASLSDATKEERSAIFKKVLSRGLSAQQIEHWLKWFNLES